MRHLKLACQQSARFISLTLVSMLFSSICLSQGASVSKIVAVLPSVQAQLVFEGAELAQQKLTSYRLITKLSPSQLIAEVESLWSKSENAKVWRHETETWLMLSKVERFPEVEVLQARRGVAGQTIARLSIGAPRHHSESQTEALLANWLPAHSKVLQSFVSSDPGRSGHLLIARSGANLQSSADWIEQRARSAGFRVEPHLKTNLGSGQSMVALLTRGKEEVVLTLDQGEQELAIVLQHSRALR